MYFSAGLKTENHLFLIENLSRCLISIHIPSGKTKIETYLPYEYTENRVSMFLLNHNIIIFSPVMRCFFVYDYLKQEIKTIELQENESDKMGFYYSNVLIKQGDFIILPFKGRKIKKYNMNGELKFKDSQWLFSIARECGCEESLFGNIRMRSACINGNQIFFSLVYNEQNYLCMYELDKEEKLCNILYHSGNIAIRGVYSYQNMLVFRRIFPDKTEIVLINLDDGEQKIIEINCPTTFEEDVYGDIHHLKASLKKEILLIEENNSKVCRQIYNFELQDTYIENGILFNERANEIKILSENYIRKYSIEKAVSDIKNSSYYQDGCKKLFDGKCIGEYIYKLYDLVTYLVEISSTVTEQKNFIKGRKNGTLIWKNIQ